MGKYRRKRQVRLHALRFTLHATARFIEISLGSSFELETQLIIARLANLGNQELLQYVLTEVVDEQKMINGFYGTLDRG